VHQFLARGVAADTDFDQGNQFSDTSTAINTSGVSGIVQPKVGDTNDLLLQYLPANYTPNPGDYVVTAGTVAGGGESLFPPGIPIGQVTSIDESSPYKAVNVHPLANLHNLDVVQVLTAVAGSRAARLGHVIASLPPGAQPGSGAVAGEGAVASTGGGG